MEEARETIFELGKEVTKGFIQLAPEEIKSMTCCKRVRQIKLTLRAINLRRGWMKSGG